MKISQLIKQSSLIEVGKSTFFITEKDFEFNGLPILKDFLVYYDGGKIIKVNKIRFGIFQSSNYPQLLLQKLDENIDSDLIIEKVSSCANEITQLPDGEIGIWHGNHFDNWTGNYSDYLERINTSPKLKLNTIEFSSMMYEYDANKQSLVHFISTKPFTINLKNCKITLPELVEISFSNNEYTIITMNNYVDYHSIKFEGALSINEVGILNGYSAENFEAKIEGYRKFRIISITKGFPIQITHDGIASIDLLNEESNRIEKYKISKI